MKYVINDYFLLLILLTVVIVGLLLKRKLLKLIFFLFFFVALLIVINISLPSGAFQFYLEPQYTLLAMYAAFPLFYDIIPSWKKEWFRTTFVGTLLLLAFVKIWNTHHPYTRRWNWYKNFLEETSDLSEKKLIFKQGTVPMDILLMDWASPNEFWLVSSLETGKSRSVIIEEKPEEFDSYLNDSTVFIGKWGAIPYKDLNPKYFSFSREGYYQKY